MKKITTVAMAAFTFAIGSLAHASVIKIDSIQATSGTLANANAYRTAVEAALLGAGRASTTLASYDNVTHASLFGTNSNFAMKSTIDFAVSSANAGLWSFRAGVDFGMGGALFIDGAAVDYKAYDMYWGNSYSNTSQILQASLNLSAGNHTITMFGFEGCCDGAQQFQFKSPTGAYTSFSSTDGLNRSAVPEPATLAMMVTGMGLIGFSRRRKPQPAQRSAA